MFRTVNGKRGAAGPGCRPCSIDDCMLVSSDALNRPGPRVVEGLEELARAIHPEAFSSEAPPSQP